jgi:hypothetical protein
MTDERYWRLRPSEFIAAGVKEIAARDGKTYSATLSKLLTSALMTYYGSEMRAKHAYDDDNK